MTRDDGLPGTSVASLFVDADGSLLVGDVGASIGRYDPQRTPGERPRFELFEESGASTTLTGSSMSQFRRGFRPRVGPNGVIWFIEDGERPVLFRHDGSSEKRFGPREGIPSGGMVQAIQPLADGSLLVATTSGLLRLVPGQKAAPWPSEASALRGLRCFDIHQDSDGLIWLATSEGVLFTDGNAWSKLDARDGLPRPRVNRVHRAADGSVWLGFQTEGVARYRPNKKIVPAPPVITDNIDRENDDGTGVPRLDTGQRVTFTFGVVDFATAVAKRQYRWQLFRGARTEQQLGRSLGAGQHRDAVGEDVSGTGRVDTRRPVHRSRPQLLETDTHCAAHRTAMA